MPLNTLVLADAQLLAGDLGFGGPYLGQVATRGRLCSSFASTNKQIMSRSKHFARDNITSLQLEFDNWYTVNATGVETGSGAEATITASIEYPVGTFTQVLFSGAATGSIADLSSLLSDAVSVTIPFGALFYVRAFFQSAGGIVYSTQGYNNSLGDRAEFAASGITDKTMNGTVGATTGGVYYPPAAIIARTSKPSVCLFGDSKTFGIQDTADTTTDTGTVARSIGPRMAYINAAIPTDRASWFKTQGAKRAAKAAYCSHAVVGFGRNDIFIGGSSLATLQANTVIIAALFAPKPVFALTLGPDTTSTDTWATVANQTVRAQESTRTGFNDWLRTGGVPEVSGMYDVALSYEVNSSGVITKNGGFWPASGTPDGIHENVTTCLAVRDARVVRPEYLSR